jgi:copper chaperone CopZ
MKKIIMTMMTMVCASLITQAQIQSANLQASGLTCSMCSNSIHQALVKLPFIEKVHANIKMSSFDITFNSIENVDIDALKNAVEDAGFFVAGLSLRTQVSSITIGKDTHLDLDGRLFHFLNAAGQSLDGNVTFQIVDRGFVPAKTFKKNSKLTSMACYQSGRTGSCCSKEAGRRLYHVII